VPRRDLGAEFCHAEWDRDDLGADSYAGLALVAETAEFYLVADDHQNA
jgi:hypothetical protein